MALTSRIFKQSHFKISWFRSLKTPDHDRDGNFPCRASHHFGGKVNHVVPLLANTTLKTHTCKTPLYSTRIVLAVCSATPFLRSPFSTDQQRHQLFNVLDHMVQQQKRSARQNSQNRPIKTLFVRIVSSDWLAKHTTHQAFRQHFREYLFVAVDFLCSPCSQRQCECAKNLFFRLCTQKCPALIIKHFRCPH